MMHFPPLFQISPPFSKNFKIFWKISKMLPIFICQNFLMTFFFSHRPQILNFPPILPVLVHFPPDWQKLLFSPTFTNFPSVFGKFTCFLHTFCVFSPPTLTMMHLCITQCTYWTPLAIDASSCYSLTFLNWFPVQIMTSS